MQADNYRWSQAKLAISEDRLDQAKKLLSEMMYGEEHTFEIEHALAVVEKKLGNYNAAIDHFERILSVQPNDPYILNNYANCRKQMNDAKGAIALYWKALEADPSYTDAYINLSLLLKNERELQQAEELLCAGIKSCNPDSRLWHSLGMVQRQAGNLIESSQSLDKALELKPDQVSLVHARARVEAEAGKDARNWYARLKQITPDDAEVSLGYAVAQFEAGEEEHGIESLSCLTRSNPTWVKGHAALAQLRWQRGDVDNFTDSYREALNGHDGNRALIIGYLGTLMRAGYYSQVLTNLPLFRPKLQDPRLFDRYEAVCSSESGDYAQAQTLFESLNMENDSELIVAYVRFLLRTGQPQLAAEIAEPLSQKPNGMLAWPYLSIAWRLIDDSRAKWLDRGEELVNYVDLDHVKPMLHRLESILRNNHYAKLHPFDQSMRQGSQTDGHLLWRTDSELVELKKVIEKEVRNYIDQLPPVDSRHPFLRQGRQTINTAASYSVLLKSKGYHVNHMHPDASISCCFYVSTPASIGKTIDNPKGWLAIGEPPQELGIDLPALKLVEPIPGRLAIFPSIMWHGTVPFEEGERLTVVSDLVMGA